MRRRRLLRPFSFFVDECLGRHEVADALRRVIEPDERVVQLDPGTLDVDWLPRAGAEGWICLSKDRQMTRTPNELRAIIDCGVGLFTLGEANGPEHARRVVAALPVIRRAATQLDVAFVARIEADGSLTIRIEEGTRLKSPRMMKGKGRRPAKGA